MKFPKHKIAAVIALFIGVMSVIAGSQVLLGYSTPDYNVLQWLVIYNVTVGVLSIGASVLIWQRSKLTWASSLIIFAAHAFVLALLLTAFEEVAAIDSIKSMAFRGTIWVIIIILVFKATQDEV